MRKNVYLYFAGKTLLLLLIVFLLDYSTGSILRYYYFKQETGRQFRATYAIEKTTEKILIFGSSRAYHHYVPSVLSDSLKQSCYNTGSPGQFIIYNYATLQAVLKRYSPKLIVFDVSTNDLREDRESYDRLSFLFPYYKDHPEIRPMAELKGPFEKYKLISSIYPFNSSFLMITGGNLSYFKKQSFDLKGYKPLERKWDKPITMRSPEPYKLDSIKERIFLSFINDCKKSGTKILLVCSPSYFQFDKPDYSIVTITKHAYEKHVPILNFTNDTSFINHPELFDDPGHLNASGSELFTKRVVDSIRANSNLKLE